MAYMIKEVSVDSPSLSDKTANLTSQNPSLRGIFGGEQHMRQRVKSKFSMNDYVVKKWMRWAFSGLLLSALPHFAMAQTPIIGSWTQVSFTCDGGPLNSVGIPPFASVTLPPSGSSSIGCFASDGVPETFKVPVSNLVPGANYDLTIEYANFGLNLAMLYSDASGRWNIFLVDNGAIGSTPFLSRTSTWETANFTFEASSNSHEILFVPEEASGSFSGQAYLNIVPSFSLSASNAAPTANAGTDQTVTTQTTVNLNGSGSTDPDGDTLSYQWSQSSGPSVTLSGASTATPSFTAPTLAVNAPDAVLTFQLIVNDATVNSSADTVNVTVESIKNNAPTLSGTPSSASVVEDVSSNLDLSAAAFADADNDPLTVTLTASAGTLSASSGGGVTIGGSGTGTLTLNASVTNINTYLDTASNIQFTTPTDGLGPYTLTISANDGIGGLASNPAVTLNVTPTPDVTNVASSAADGHYKTGDTVVVDVTFDMTVDVTDTPTLTLETGTVDHTATYTGGDGTNTLSFEYVVQAGDTAADLDIVSTTALSGTISGNGLAADLALPSPGSSGSLGANKAIVIDTTAPMVTDGGISISGATGTGGAFKVGDTVTAEWDTSGSDGDINITGSLGRVTADFSAFGGGTAVPATLSGTAWTATYTILANTSTSGANLNVSVTATDAAGNATTSSDTTNATVDATPPTVSDTNIDISGATGTSGAFKIGDTVTATWNNAAGGDNNGDIASVTVDFSEFGGGASVTAVDSSGTWTATYTIVTGAIDATSRNVRVTATDTAGNSTIVEGATNATVDNIAPTVTAGSISVSGATGNPNNSVFKIGDTVMVSWDNTGIGDDNSDIISAVTVDFSDFGGGAAVVATNSAGTWIASFPYSAGTVAGSSYGVAVTSTDNAGNTTTTADDAALSLDNVETDAPVGTQLDAASNSGSTADTITSVTKPSISGTSEPNATITIYVGGALVGATTADGNGAWSYTFTTALSEGSNAITATATDYVGNTSEASPALVLTLDTMAPSQPAAPLLDDASNTGSTSDLITYDPAPAISGTAEMNSLVEVFVGGQSKGTTQTDGSGNWSFPFPNGALTEGANAITVTATDAAANTSTVSAALTITLDTLIPVIAITDPLMGDNLFNAAETPAVTISGTTTDVDDDQTVTLSVSDGTTTLPFTTTVSGNAWTTTVDLSSLSDGALAITADVTDVAGNPATQASHTIAKDIVLPSVVVSGPTEIVTSAFNVTIVFSEEISGFELFEITVENGAAVAWTGSGTTYVATIDPVMGQIVKVSVADGVAIDAANNPNTQSNVYEVQAGSPASEFEKYREEIKQVLIDEAERSLRSTLSVNQRLVRGARERFVADQRQRDACTEEDTAAAETSVCGIGLVSRNNVPFDVDGSFELSGSTLSTNGNSFEQTGDYEGTYRRLFFGDFDIQHDADTDSTTAKLTARVAWEHLVSDKTILGYFVGGELARSTINGTFDGDQDRFGLTVGGYAVRQLDEQLFVDGFISFGAGRNDLEMANDVLALTSDYTTRTATAGAALSGIYEYDQYEFRPELAFSYGKTFIDDVDFTGRAYGLVDNALSLDAGDVSIANLTFRPEFRVPMDGLAVADSRSLFSFAPRAICEQVKTTVTTEGCGGGAELGIVSTSEDGMTDVNARIMMDRIGDSTRSGLQFNLEHRF